MKRIVIGVVAGLALITAAACGSKGGLGENCTKYLACATKVGGTYKSSAETAYGSSSACVTEPSVKEACESGCKTSLESLKTSGLSADAGCA